MRLTPAAAGRRGRPAARYHPAMDHTAGPILEIGLVLLAAVGGRVAGAPRRPAGVVGYLALGIVVSPFTPGYVADREQLQLLADVGVVLLLFEVGIEVDILRIRSEQRGLFVAAPVQIVVTTLIAGRVLSVAGSRSRSRPRCSACRSRCRRRS